jgi:hypothetical protein
MGILEMAAWAFFGALSNEGIASFSQLKGVLLAELDRSRIPLFILISLMLSLAGAVMTIVILQAEFADQISGPSPTLVFFLGFASSSVLRDVARFSTDFLGTSRVPHD